jgi:hypothetical protein
MRPPPLGVALEVRANGDGRTLLHGEAPLASAAPASLALETPAPPSFSEAAKIARSFPGLERHPFPGCFVCGPARKQGDGLRIFPGSSGRDAVAAPWSPDASLDRGDGWVRREHLWAALDCPGYFAVTSDGRTMLLGQITGELRGAVRVGEPCVVLGWKIASEGRKHRAGTALFGEDGKPRGLAEAVWIEPRTPASKGTAASAAVAAREAPEHRCRESTAFANPD